MNPYKNVEKTQKSKSTSSKDALKDAFVDLYIRKPYDQISVKLLCEQAHVARTTFYANYANIDDMLEELEDDLIHDLLQVNQHNCSDDPEGIRNYTNNLMKYVDKNRKVLRAFLIKEINGRFLIKFKNAIKCHFYDIVCAHNGGKENGVILEMIAGMAIGAYTYLIDHNEMISGDQVVNTFNDVFRILENE